MREQEINRPKRLDIKAWQGMTVLAVIVSLLNALVPAGFMDVDIFLAISSCAIKLIFLSRLNREFSVGVLVEFWQMVPANSFDRVLHSHEEEI